MAQELFGAVTEFLIRSLIRLGNLLRSKQVQPGELGAQVLGLLAADKCTITYTDEEHDDYGPDRVHDFLANLGCLEELVGLKKYKLTSVYPGC